MPDEMRKPVKCILNEVENLFWTKLKNKLDKMIFLSSFLKISVCIHSVTLLQLLLVCKWLVPKWKCLNAFQSRKGNRFYFQNTVQDFKWFSDSEPSKLILSNLKCILTQDVQYILKYQTKSCVYNFAIFLALSKLYRIVYKS